MKSDINPFHPLSNKTKSKEVVSDIRRFLENVILNADKEVYQRLRIKIEEICQVTVFIEPEWGKGVLSEDYVSVFHIIMHSHYRMVETIMTPVKKENFAHDFIKNFPAMKYFSFEGRWHKRDDLSKIEWIYF